MEHYCENCKWFDLSTFEDGFRESWCIRYPPMAYVGPPVSEMGLDEVPSVMRYWEPPTVGIRHSCGEWAPRDGVTARPMTVETVPLQWPTLGAEAVNPLGLCTLDVEPHDRPARRSAPSSGGLSVRRLKETNRKLTEILKDALPALNSMCGECCYQQECYSAPDCVAMEQTVARMRDLGIEV